MGTLCKPNVIAAALFCALVITTAHAQQATTSDRVETRIGTLNFERGFPTEETKRARCSTRSTTSAPCRPTCGLIRPFRSSPSGWQTSGTLESIYNDLIIADNFADPKGLWLTANDTTIYAMANVDLGRSGPIVVEIPPGAIVGLIDDFWQRSIADVGLPGPDGAKGGKFLLLPPGYKGDVPQTGYHVLQGTMNNYNVMVRGIVVNDDKDAAVQNTKQVKVYPLSESKQSQAEQVHLHVGKGHEYASACGDRVLGATLGVRQQQPRPGARPFLHGHAQAAGDREGQAVSARRAAARDPRRGCTDR